MHHFTCWTLFISRINRAWLYKGHEDSGWQLNVDLAQLVRHWAEDLEVLVSNLTGGNLWRIAFCFSLHKDLLDNLTEMPIMKNSIGLKIWRSWFQTPLQATFDDFFALPCVKICQIIWQKRLSWKTQLLKVKRQTGPVCFLFGILYLDWWRSFTLITL